MRSDVPIQGLTRSRTPRNRSFRVRTRVWLAGALAMLVGATPALGGSSGVPFRGALVGTASTLGRVTLRRNGMRVVSLKFGQYRVVVDDATPHSGFVFERPNGTEITVTSTPFVGKRTKTVTLTPGRWSFHGALGALHEFTVTR